MKACGPDDNLSLQAADKADTLTLMFESKNNRVSEYELKLMDVDAEHLAIPESDYDCTFQMSSTEFKNIVTNMSALSETVTVSVTKEGIQFACEGDIGSGSITVKPNADSIDEEDEENQTVIHLNSPVSVLLSVKFLVDFSKATPLSKTVTLGITNDLPVLVEYKVSDVGHIRYYLAPKMSEEDE
ncbi:hypothetical protein HDU91_007523 [Kappamyces sp. JEL0680]|nr:hypothetical protein HDU91_007523 [Kappamyces sp. JEL0680]